MEEKEARIESIGRLYNSLKEADKERLHERLTSHFDSLEELKTGDWFNWTEKKLKQLEAVISGYVFTVNHVPDMITVYKNDENLSSRVRFGWIEDSNKEPEEDPEADKS